MCLHPSVSLNNEKICCEDKIAVCEKTAGLRCRKFSDLNYVCSKVLVRVKIFEFQDILNENRFLSTFRGHSNGLSVQNVARMTQAIKQPRSQGFSVTTRRDTRKLWSWPVTCLPQKWQYLTATRQGVARYSLIHEIYKSPKQINSQKTSQSISIYV